LPENWVIELEEIFDQRIIKIGERLKELRIKAGYPSYEHFAWDNKLSRRGYWALEKGTNFTIKTLLKVLDIHKMSLKEFFSSVENK